MPQAKQATVEFALRWQSVAASHSARLDYERVNFWRVFFPGMCVPDLMSSQVSHLSDHLDLEVTGLGTESARDRPCPQDDPYAGQFVFADPLYAAWGRAG